ncbi:hypothetical protein [Bacillus safensis]|uniref:Uncharacterized protein n=1 Tax=Bacillus safensis TaxID=561879 RepID=A0A1L6ZN56_BACIA|nr:hypothetical protein [Bacillus safensis]APT47949.1 hypothetical protein BSA145_20000 [Bacillus safensis]
MKKFRGKKRYFRHMWEEVNTCDLKLDRGSWFYFWHTHLDFFGVGENSLKIRREHIKAHIALYHRLLKQLESFEKPYQTWICIHEHDPGLDAVYVHTPNPYDSYFPHKVEELERNCKLPHTFKDLIDLHQFDVSYDQSECGEVYYIQSKEQGIRL